APRTRSTCRLDAHRVRSCPYLPLCDPCCPPLEASCRSRSPGRNFDRYLNDINIILEPSSGRSKKKRTGLPSASKGAVNRGGAEGREVRSRTINRASRE